MIIRAVPRREIGAEDFADLTPIAVSGVWWDGPELAVEFVADLPGAVAGAVARRMCSRNANEEVLRERAEQALDANRAYLAVATPDAAAVRQQVERLTRQNVAVMRLLLGFLDATD